MSVLHHLPRSRASDPVTEDRCVAMSDSEKRFCLDYLRRDLEHPVGRPVDPRIISMIDILEGRTEPSAGDIDWLAGYMEEKIEELLDELYAYENDMIGWRIREARDA